MTTQEADVAVGTGDRPRILTPKLPLSPADHQEYSGHVRLYEYQKETASDGLSVHSPSAGTRSANGAKVFGRAEPVALRLW
jgi:hypothetical protein